MRIGLRFIIMACIALSFLSSCAKGDSYATAIVFEDLNGNGIIETDEKPIKGITINIKYRKLLDVAVTDEHGKIERFIPGARCNAIELEMIVPKGYEPTTQTKSAYCNALFGLQKKPN